MGLDGFRNGSGTGLSPAGPRFDRDGTDAGVMMLAMPRYPKAATSYSSGAV